MEELLTNYGLFLAKTFTLVGAFIIIISFLYSASKKQKKLDTLEVENLNDKYKRMKDIVEKEILLKKAYKDNQKKMWIYISKNSRIIFDSRDYSFQIAGSKKTPKIDAI